MGGITAVNLHERRRRVSVTRRVRGRGAETVGEKWRRLGME